MKRKQTNPEPDDDKLHFELEDPTTIIPSSATKKEMEELVNGLKKKIKKGIEGFVMTKRLYDSLTGFLNVPLIEHFGVPFYLANTRDEALMRCAVLNKTNPRYMAVFDQKEEP